MISKEELEQQIEFYEKHLENVNSGLFLQVEGDIGRYYVYNFLDTGIFKPSGEEGNTIKDGYNRTITLHKFIVDYKRINQLYDEDWEFMEELEARTI